MDRISTLPPGIIETILCLLPIQEAGRTSVLSKNWRYRWSKIPKLAFIEEMSVRNEWFAIESEWESMTIESEWGSMTNRRKLLNAIDQVLLMHEGPILEFSLVMWTERSCAEIEIDHIMLHLSRRNTVKILQLDLCAKYVLPVSLLSFHQLTELCVTNCELDLDLPLSFNGFGHLTNLYVHDGRINGETLIGLLSGCPLLKTLTLYCIDVHNTTDYTIVDLFERLHVIEHLSLMCDFALCFDTKRLPKQLPTALVHLKYFHIAFMCFNSHKRASFLSLLIKSSPNLEKLEIGLIPLVEYKSGTASVTLDDYSDVMLERLSELMIEDFTNKKNDFEFVKLILAKSPALKEVRIIVSMKMTPKAELSRISKRLLSFPCASPVVKITVSEF